MTFKTNNLRKLFFLAVFCFFEGHFFYAQSFFKSDGGIIYTDNSGAAFIYDAGAKIILPPSDSFFINAGYTGLTSDVNYIEVTTHNVFFGLGNEAENQGFSFSGLFGKAEDELRIRPGSVRIILKNLKYNFLSFDFYKTFSQDFGLSSEAFFGSANTGQSNLYIMNGRFEIPYYGGCNINFTLPQNFDLQLFYAGGALASHNEKSVKLGDGNLSLFDIKSGKAFTFGTTLEQAFYGGLGFTYAGGEVLIKTTSNSQNTILYPFSFLYVDANATLYFANLFLDYKIKYGNFNFCVQTDFRFNCRSYINYYYKYTMKKSLIFSGENDSDRDSLVFSNCDFIWKFYACADYTIPQIQTKLYMKKEFLLPVISDKTKKLFGMQSENSRIDNSSNFDELIKTVLLSGLYIGFKIEF